MSSSLTEYFLKVSMAPSKSNFVTTSLKRATTLKYKKTNLIKRWRLLRKGKRELTIANLRPSPLISDPVTCRTASVTNDERSSFSTESVDAKPNKELFNISKSIELWRETSARRLNEYQMRMRRMIGYWIWFHREWNRRKMVDDGVLSESGGDTAAKLTTSFEMRLVVSEWVSESKER